MESSLLVLLLCFSLSSNAAANPVHLEVGIYNHLPDLNSDGLASYKQMLQDGFNNDEHTVNAEVDPDKYDPYTSNFEKYFNTFDLLEIDTINLEDLIKFKFIIPITHAFPDVSSVDFISASIDAVTVDKQIYAVPTLVCGNFLIGLTPGTADTCDLKSSRENYRSFYETLTSCKSTLMTASPYYDRLFGGKMNDEYGYYLPDLYIDGYIDVHGKDSASQAIDNISKVKPEVDAKVCNRLKWYIGMCANKDASTINKCYQNFRGSYVQEDDNIYSDVQTGSTMFHFGFSERVAMILKKNSDLRAYAALSAPLGERNHLLMYTDALVISKKAWTKASEAKRNAMIAFVKYFTSTETRTKIALGVDVDQIRYLLQAKRAVYSDATISQDPVFMDLYEALQTGVASPPKPFTTSMGMMQEALSKYCLPNAVANPPELPNTNSNIKESTRGKNTHTEL